MQPTRVTAASAPQGWTWILHPPGAKLLSDFLLPIEINGYAHPDSNRRSMDLKLARGIKIKEAYKHV
jgi:hypothetical protein